MREPIEDPSPLAARNRMKLFQANADENRKELRPVVVELNGLLINDDVAAVATHDCEIIFDPKHWGVYAAFPKNARRDLFPGQCLSRWYSRGSANPGQLPAAGQRRIYGLFLFRYFL